MCFIISIEEFINPYLYHYFFNTTLTIFFGTMITFSTLNPSKYFWLFSSANTCFWISSLGVSTGKVIWKRALPLKEMVSCMSFSFRYCSSYLGHAASQTLPCSPSAAHNSYAMCGANGAMRMTRSVRSSLLWHFC